MSPSAHSRELPNSLRNMIAEAKAAVDRWDDNPQDADSELSDGLDAAKNWTIRLSQGEYEDDLYWECVAEDCEAVGNWDGAKKAYQNVIRVSQKDLKQSSAYSSIGDLCSILGDERQALAHYHNATECDRVQNSDIFYRLRLAQEATQLLRMGRVRAAKKLAIQGLAAFDVNWAGHLGLVRLKIVLAACESEQGRTAHAWELLSNVWTVLESQRAIWEQYCSDIGSGTHSTYSSWWRLEARCRRREGRIEPEIEAWRKSLDHARLAADGWNRVNRDIYVVRALESLADAYFRGARQTECLETRGEDTNLREKWHLPAAGAPRTEGQSWLRRLFTLRSSR